MMKRILDWMDHRAGWRKLTHEALYENVPGGARWRYVWGSTLVFCFVVQIITGIFLWMNYAPSSQTAWESVWFIQDQMAGGWLLRGLHHMIAHAMIVLMALHLMQVVIDGAYKAPRELNFWIGLVLLQIVLGLSLTGYLLPWDQKGFWATKVATNLLAAVPGIGPALQKLVIGGADYGHHTLTRFFALHAGVLPGLMIILLVAHVALFRRHGLTAKMPKRNPDAAFWPDQVLKDAVACLAVLATVLFILWKPRFAGHAPGIELGAPADPSEPYSAARPDWYFLFLFEFLKYFPGRSEIFGAFVIPGIGFLILALMPFVGRWRLGHRFNVIFLFTVLVGAGLLTAAALREDANNPTYAAAVREAEHNAARVRELAASPNGIPVAGAVTLLRNDALMQGPKIFAAKCASCHRYDGHDGLGNVPKDAQTASDLKGFASREWLAGLLDPARIATTNYFGATKHVNGKMVKFVANKVMAYSPEKKEQLAKVIAAVSAEAKLKSQRESDANDAAIIEDGKRLFGEDGVNCANCHQFHNKDEEASGPDLTGYGSRDWLIRFINDPAHVDFYGDRNDRMPAFGRDGILSPEQISLVADWLRGDWYEAERAGR